jgi:hypothetical protein
MDSSCNILACQIHQTNSSHMSDCFSIHWDPSYGILQ